MNTWYADPNASRHLLVTADAGRGKTALLVRWLDQLSTCKAVIFVPISIRYETNRTSFFYQVLATRLAELVGENLTTSSTDAGQHYREKALEYIDRLEAEGKPCLIVIDGLDEASGWTVNESVLGDLDAGNIRILASARLMVGDADASAWLRRLGWGGRSEATQSILIPPLVGPEVADVLRRSDSSLDALSHDHRVIEELMRLTEGDPLLVTYYIEDLGALTDMSADAVLAHLGGKSAGFGAFFKDWLEKQGGLNSELGKPVEDQQVKRILAILASALGPLTMKDLAHLVERTYGAEALISKDSFAPLSRFIIGDGSRDGFALCHPKLRDFLRQDYFGGAESIQASDDAFVSWGRETVRALQSVQPRAPQAPSYLLNYFAQHIAVTDAGSEVYFDLIREGWRKAWESDHEGDGLRGFKNDVEIAHAAFQEEFRTEGFADSDATTGMIESAIVLSVLSSISGNISDELIVMALERDRISLGQAVFFAQRDTQSKSLRSLAQIMAVIPPGRRAKVFDVALENLRSLHREDDIKSGVAQVAAFADEDQQADILELSLRLKHEWMLAGCIRGLAPLVNAACRQDLIKAAIDLRDALPRGRALASLAESASEEEVAQLAEAARSVYDHEFQADILTNLATQFPNEERIEKAILAALKVRAKLERVRLLARLAAISSVSLPPEALQSAEIDGTLSMIDACSCLYVMGRFLDDDALCRGLVTILSPIPSWYEEGSTWGLDLEIRGQSERILERFAIDERLDNLFLIRLGHLVPSCFDGIYERIRYELDEDAEVHVDNLAAGLAEVSQVLFREAGRADLITERADAASDTLSDYELEFEIQPSERAESDSALSILQPPHPAPRDPVQSLEVLLSGEDTRQLSKHAWIPECLGLLPEVPDDLAAQAIDLSFTRALSPSDPTEVSRIAEGLAEFLSSEDRTRVFDRAVAIRGEVPLVQALVALLPYLSSVQRSAVDAIAPNLENLGNRIWLQCELVKDAANDARETVYSRLLAEIEVSQENDGLTAIELIRRYLPSQMQGKADRIEAVIRGSELSSDTERPAQSKAVGDFVFQSMEFGVLPPDFIEQNSADLSDRRSDLFIAIVNAIDSHPNPHSRAEMRMALVQVTDNETAIELARCAFEEIFEVEASSVARHEKQHAIGMIITRTAPYQSLKQLFSSIERLGFLSGNTFDDALGSVLMRCAEHVESGEVLTPRSQSQEVLLTVLFGSDQQRDALGPAEYQFNALLQVIEDFRGPSTFDEDAFSLLGKLRLVTTWMPLDLYPEAIGQAQRMEPVNLRASTLAWLAMAADGARRDEIMPLFLAAVAACEPAQWAEIFQNHAELFARDEASQAFRMAREIPDQQTRDGALAGLRSILPNRRRSDYFLERSQCLAQLPRATAVDTAVDLVASLEDFGQPETARRCAENVVNVLNWWVD